jgi:MFS family permease
MFFSVICYIAYGALALTAYQIVNPAGDPLTGAALDTAQDRALGFLTAGSIILALGNGTVEAFINPVVATLFSREKAKWLNILHAGWPGGLVLGGLLTMLLVTRFGGDWRLLIYIISLPAIIYLVMLLKAKFPVNERVASGVSYREMLAEFGAIGAFIAAFLVFFQLGDVFALPLWLTWTLVIVSAVAYGLYCRSLGRPMMILLCLIMMPLAITELGTDGAIVGIMTEPLEKIGRHPLWVLIYTSAIMMVLRFFAGSIIHRVNPLGLLAISSVVAILGLLALSGVSGLFWIFAAATLYGFGKSFFWPTMLGTVAEQYPRGGAVTLNSIAGIGMLAVGILGSPVIGMMQEGSAATAIEEKLPGTYAEVSKKDTFFNVIDYTAVDSEKVSALPQAKRESVEKTVQNSKQSALAKVAVFPVVMLVSFLGLLLYFKARGGYKPVDLSGEQVAGGTKAPAEF